MTTTQQVLIQAGLSLMAAEGYNATGIQAVIDRAGVPKGSFYHHFKNKEVFGAEVASAYYEQQNRIVRRFLGDETKTPRARLRGYFAEICRRMEQGDFTCGCFAGALTLEVADRSQLIQQRLSEIFAGWQRDIAQAIKEAQEAGEVARLYPPEVLSCFILMALEGALLRAKADRNAEPLTIFLKMLDERLLS